MTGTNSQPGRRDRRQGNWTNAATARDALAARPEPLEGRRLLSAVGPDAFGYVADPAPYEAIDLVPGAPGVSSTLDGWDDGAEVIDLAGHTFNFYGTSYTTLFVNSNGLITFGAPDTDYFNSDLSVSSPHPAAAPLWDDWVTFVDGNDQVLYQFQDITGDGAADRLVVEWNDIYTISGGESPVTFQAVLELDTGDQPGDIVFNYVDLDTGNGGSDGVWSTVGVKAAGDRDPARLLISYDAPSPLVGSGKAVRVWTNRRPAAADLPVTTEEDTPLTFTLRAPDRENDSLTWRVVSGPRHGTLSGTGPDLVYTPDANYHGPDRFTFAANDGRGDSNVATVDLTVTPVNDAPVAFDDAGVTDEDGVLTGNVLGNDADVEGDALSAELLSGPLHGTLTLDTTTGAFTYTPAANFYGADAFTYRVADGSADGNVATVAVTINPVNDAPSASPETYNATQDTRLDVAAPGLLANDTDVEGDSLGAVLVEGPRSGALTLNPDGSFSYVPSAGFSGTDTFRYGTNDGTATGAAVTVTVNVAPVEPTGTVALVPDVFDPSKTNLLVYGTPAADAVQITPAAGGGVDVVMNGTARGTFHPTGRIVVFAGAGDDVVQVAGGVDRNPARLFGGAGNDRLNLGNGGGLAFGGDGDDRLQGGNGRDILIGGAGADWLNGNGGDDQLMTDGTWHEDAGAEAARTATAWSTIAADWNAPRTLSQRISNLAGGGPTKRLNGQSVLNRRALRPDGRSRDVVVGHGRSDGYASQSADLKDKLVKALEHLADKFNKWGGD